MSNRNRTAGHNYERIIRKEMLPFFPDCLTSRYASREMDDKKVDLVDTGMFYIQCKFTKNYPNFHTLLKEDMPQDSHINLVFQKRKNKGDIVVMNKEDFYEILTMLKREQIL